MSRGKAIGVGFLGMAAGFLGGIWFVASGVAFRFLAPPPLAAPPAAPTRTQAPPRPRVEGVAVPEPSVIAGGSAGLGGRIDREGLIPTLGCRWIIEPQSFRLGHHWIKHDPDGYLCGYASADPATGDLRYLVVQSTRRGAKVLNLRPVVFDAEARPIEVVSGNKSASRGGDGEFQVEEFHPKGPRRIPAKDLAYFGIEQVTPESARLIAEAARKEADARKIALLPPPRVGHPYPLDMLDADGGPIRSADFLGKAVVIVVWGTRPGDQIVPSTLKSLRRAYKAEELALVGVSFAGSSEDARAEFGPSGTGDRLVVLPNDEPTRRIWAAGSEIVSVPVALLVDARGVLRTTCHPFFVEREVEKLFGREKPATVVHRTPPQGAGHIHFWTPPSDPGRPRAAETR